jgi:hypothetical protein
MPWYAFWHLVCFGDFGASKCFFWCKKHLGEI